MKNPIYICLVIMLIVLSNSLYGQEDSLSRTSIVLNFSTIDSEAFSYTPEAGSGSFTGGQVFAYGIGFLKMPNERLNIEIGLEYSKHNFNYRVSSFDPETFDLITKTANVSVNLWSIPVFLRVKFWRYFFLQGGTMLDMDFSSSDQLTNQTGFGLNLGLGLNFDFNFGGSFFVVPYAESHALIEFDESKRTDHITEAGIRFGMTYRIK